MASSLPQAVAAEIRAELGRAQVSSSELARRVGKSHSYVWRRLKGEVPFDVADLDEISKALNVPISRFMPNEVTAA